jgi:hypothetical protein
VRFTFVRGRFALPLPTVFALVRFALAARFAFEFAFVLPLALSFAFRFLGRFGLLSFAELAFALRLLFVFSSGVTVSGDSPAFVGRLISIATVCPVFTTSPARGN